MASTDHHSEYLSRAVVALTPEGRARADELLDELTREAGSHDRVVRFAAVRRAEVDTGRIEPAVTDKLTQQELDILGTGFTTIRDGEPLDEVTDWANAVLALLQDDAAR